MRKTVTKHLTKEDIVEVEEFIENKELKKPAEVLKDRKSVV